MKTLREALQRKTWNDRDGETVLTVDEAILALRQWMEDEGLAIVPREATQEMTGAVLDACAPRSEIMKTYTAMIAAVPDALETKP